MQRIFDIILSASAILVLSILLTPIMIVLRFTGEGEVFFSQERIGRFGKPFKLLKFATMLKNSPNVGTGTVTVKSDPRVLPVGKFLRSSKINELPQLLNILLGDMSIIGPRPLTHQTFIAYSDAVRETIGRVRPGLSGIGSIVFRNEEDILSGADSSMQFYNEVIAPYKGNLESWYVRNNSIGIYVKAIFVTVFAVFKPGTSIAWKIFSGLPIPPHRLRSQLNYIE